jgi:hypothetical protein
MGGTSSMHGQTQTAYKILTGKYPERDHLGDQEINGIVISQCIFGKEIVNM